MFFLLLLLFFEMVQRRFLLKIIAGIGCIDVYIEKRSKGLVRWNFQSSWDFY